jgi:hypothetical protein
MWERMDLDWDWEAESEPGAGPFGRRRMAARARWTDDGKGLLFGDFPGVCLMAVGASGLVRFFARCPLPAGCGRMI